MNSVVQLSGFLINLAAYYPQQTWRMNAPQFSSPLSGIPVIINNNNNNNGGGNGVHIFANNADTIKAVRAINKEDKEENRQSQAALVGGIATIIFAGFSALTLRSYYKDQEELKKAQDFQQYVLPTLPPLQRERIAFIVRKHIEIVETKCSKNRNIAIISMGLLASGAAAFLGGMFALSWLITTAVVCGVAIAAFGVFTIVWHWQDNTSLPAAVQQDIEQLSYEIDMW